MVLLDFSLTLPLKMANKKVGFVLTEGNIHSIEVFPTRRMKTFITALMKGIPNEHTWLIRAKIMDTSGTPKHKEGNLRN